VIPARIHRRCRIAQTAFLRINEGLTIAVGSWGAEGGGRIDLLAVAWFGAVGRNCPLPTSFAKPEPYLFSCVDGDQVLVVRVLEMTPNAAVSRFNALTSVERRRLAVSRQVRSEADSLATLRGWVGRLLPRIARAGQKRA
jgi:hypothetical protein